MKTAEAIRPRIDGFLYPVVVLQKAEVAHNIWSLTFSQSLLLTQKGPVVMQRSSFVTNAVDVATFNEAAFITALPVDEAGENTFWTFLGYLRIRASYATT